ncbi:MAG: 3-dehydroquinate synthase, partial [Erysipelotrichaceae bacterium]|nr:3-dehydroquinate synthase [Erysipelotrichaceae bacterium]
CKDTSYPIRIGAQALNELRSIFQTDRKIALITDSGVPVQWVRTVQAQCPDAFLYTLPQGEGSKNFEQFQNVLREMIAHSMSRKDAVIALGGGVVGDLAGFAAASYMRGIDFYNIPTTLLSQVDSSVGGKVAIDLDGYKNLVGAFWQPKGVLIDPDVLSTLPARQIHNGLAEALKTALIRDADLLDLFERDPLDLEEIITRSIHIKKDVVQQDEKENGVRQILNFGHTIGHAIESAYGLSSYYHGECVAMGMLFFIDNYELKQRVLRIMKRLDLPDVPAYDVDTLMHYLRHDKKSHAGRVNIIQVKQAGSCVIEPMTFEQIRTVLERGPL